MLGIAVWNITVVPVEITLQTSNLNGYNQKYANAACIQHPITALYEQSTAEIHCIFSIFVLMNLDV